FAREALPHRDGPGHGLPAAMNEASGGEGPPRPPSLLKRVFRLEKARARLAFSGALLSAIFLGLLALGTRSLIRGMTFNDIDEELYTLSVALGSSFELEGLEESKRDTLKAGLEANAFEFRLANHSAILFRGDVPVAASGNLLKQ